MNFDCENCQSSGPNQSRYSPAGPRPRVPVAHRPLNKDPETVSLGVDRAWSFTTLRPDGSPLSVEVARARLIRSESRPVATGFVGSVPLVAVVMLFVVQLAAVAALVLVAS